MPITMDPAESGLLAYGATSGDKGTKGQGQTRVKAKTMSVGSARTSVTMDLSHMPVPRYLECLSAAEDLYSDIENTYTRAGGDGYTHISF